MVCLDKPTPRSFQSWAVMFAHRSSAPRLRVEGKGTAHRTLTSYRVPCKGAAPWWWALYRERGGDIVFRRSTRHVGAKTPLGLIRAGPPRREYPRVP